MNGMMVHPFEDDEFIAGNATCGLEILEDLPEVDAVVGGVRRRRNYVWDRDGGSRGQAGRKSFCSRAAERLAAGLFVREGFGAEFSELAAQPGWMAAAGKSVFPRMWALANHLLEGSIVVTLDEIRRAMKLVAERNHVIAEGAGACAVAAALSGKCGRRKSGRGGQRRQHRFEQIHGADRDLAK